MHYNRRACTPTDSSMEAAPTSKIALQPQRDVSNFTKLPLAINPAHMHTTCTPQCTPHAIRVQVTCVHRKTAFTIYKMENLQRISSSNTRYSRCIHSQKRGTNKVCLHVMCLLHGSECVVNEVHVWQRVSVYSKLSQDNAVKKAQKRQAKQAQSVVRWFTQRGEAKQRCRIKAQNYTVCQAHKQFA